MSRAARRHHHQLIPLEHARGDRRSLICAEYAPQGGAERPTRPADPSRGPARIAHRRRRRDGPPSASSSSSPAESPYAQSSAPASSACPEPLLDAAGLLGTSAVGASQPPGQAAVGIRSSRVHTTPSTPSSSPSGVEYDSSDADASITVCPSSRCRSQAGGRVVAQPARCTSRQNARRAGRARRRRCPRSAVQTSSLSRSRSRRRSAARERDRVPGERDAQTRPALARERRHAVARRQRPVDVERGDDGAGRSVVRARAERGYTLGACPTAPRSSTTSTSAYRPVARCASSGAARSSPRRSARRSAAGSRCRCGARRRRRRVRGRHVRPRLHARRPRVRPQARKAKRPELEARRPPRAGRCRGPARPPRLEAGHSQAENALQPSLKAAPSTRPRTSRGHRAGPQAPRLRAAALRVGVRKRRRQTLLQARGLRREVRLARDVLGRPGEAEGPLGAVGRASCPRRAGSRTPARR